MSERRDGIRYGRDVAEMVGDAVVASLADAFERLRPAPAPAVEEPAAPAPEPAASASAGVPPLPARAAADLVGAAVAAIVPTVLARIEPDDLLDRVDVQRIVDRIDIDEVVSRVDLDALAARIDVDALLARVDIDALVSRIDMGAVAREAIEGIDIGALVRDSTATIGTDMVDDLRFQAMRADDIVARLIDRVAGRRERRTALDPPGSS